MTNVDFTSYKKIVRYFWDPEPMNDDASNTPIWCLGEQYRTRDELSPSSNESVNGSMAPGRSHSAPSTPVESSSNSFDEALAYSEIARGSEEVVSWPRPFLDDFESRIWLTYRSHFPPIPKSQDPKASASMSFSTRLSQLVDQGGFTSDAGWGCMIRSGQCVLANAISILNLGRDWRRGTREEEEKRILALFADDPKAPYSIHRFVKHGATACGKHPGQWFGPSAAAQCIQALCNEHEASGLRVYVTGDGSEVYEDSFMKVCRSESGAFRPTLILVGTRLGLERVTPAYWEGLKSTLQMHQSVGIAGGQPSSSHYFIGAQGSNLFYLDPHQTRPALPYLEDPRDYTIEDVNTCHTRRLRRLNLTEMDPSMLVAFLIRDEDDWSKWKRSVAEVPGPAVIRISDTEPVLDGVGVERQSAVDEVESFDDEDDDSMAFTS